MATITTNLDNLNCIKESDGQINWATLHTAEAVTDDEHDCGQGYVIIDRDGEITAANSLHIVEDNNGAIYFEVPHEIVGAALLRSIRENNDLLQRIHDGHTVTTMDQAF